jgi:hypothetical protein
MALDLTAFGNAVQRLRDGLARHHREPDDEQLRDGLIQRVEFAYELAIRLYGAGCSRRRHHPMRSRHCPSPS